MKNFLKAPATSFAAFLTIFTTILYLLPAPRVTQPLAPAPLNPVPTVLPNESQQAYDEALARSIADTTAIEDVQAWHRLNDDHAIQGIGFKKRSLDLRTALIVDQGTRTAGRAFLDAIDYEVDDAGDDYYTLNRSKLEGIDPEKLKRWAAIALTVLTIAEPFVPPPYNLAVHAAIMLLKLYLAVPDPAPQRIFGDHFAV